MQFPPPRSVSFHVGTAPVSSLRFQALLFSRCLALHRGFQSDRCNTTVEAWAELAGIGGPDQSQLIWLERTTGLETAAEGHYIKLAVSVEIQLVRSSSAKSECGNVDLGAHHYPVSLPWSLTPAPKQMHRMVSKKKLSKKYLKGTTGGKKYLKNRVGACVFPYILFLLPARWLGPLWSLWIEH